MPSRTRPQNRRRRSAAIIAAALATCAAMNSRAVADTTAEWLNTSGDVWTNPADWSTNPNYPNNGTPGGTNYQALFDLAGSGPYTVTLNSNITIDSLTLNTANATLNQTLGTLTVGNASISAGTFTLGAGTLSVSYLDLSGGTFNWTGGTLNTTFFIEQTGGTFLSSVGLYANVGYFLGGGSLQLSGSNPLTVGASFSVANGARASAPVVYIGKNIAGGSASVYDTGSSLSASTLLAVGYGAGGSGTLAVSYSGQASSTGALVIGGDGGAGTLTLGNAGYTDSGAALTTTGSIYVGGDTASYSGSLGTGVVNVYGGTTLSTAGTLKIWNSAGTSVNLAGGTIQAASLDTTGAPAEFNWTSGTLQITGTAGFTVGPSGPLGSFAVGSGQTLQTNYPTTIASGGTLSISGGALVAPSTIDNGSIRYSAGTLATPTITVNAGATFSAVPGSGSLSSSNALALSTGSFFDMADGAIGTYSLTGTGTPLVVGAASGSPVAFTFELGNGSTGTDRLILTSGTASILASGATVTIMPLAVDTALAPGNYTFMSAAGGLGTASLSLSTTAVAVNGSTYTFSLAGSTANAEVLTVSTTGISSEYWQGGQGSGGNATWSTTAGGSSNFTVDSAGATATNSLPGASTDVHFTTTDGGSNLNTVLGQNLSIRGLFIDSTASGAVTVAGAGNTLTIGADALTSASGAASATISAPVVLANTQTWTINNASLTDSGGISDAGNTLGLTIAGTGTLVVSGTNTYTGGTTINAGASLLASGNSSLPNNQNVVNNGNLTIAATNTVGVVSGTGNTTVSAGASLTAAGLAQNSLTVNSTFTQTGGTNSLTGILDIATSGGSTGTYSLGNSAGLSVGGSEFIGDSGNGIFNQTGGTNTAATIVVGNVVGSTGTYCLSNSGALSVSGSEYIGKSGNGTFNQTGGTNTDHLLYIGYNNDSTGAYTLSGSGSLMCSALIVAISGNGTFTQSGGTNNCLNGLFVGNAAGSIGIYNLGGTGSVLAVGFGENHYEAIGDSGNGAMNQTGGTNTTPELYVGELAGSTGNYTLSGTGALSFIINAHIAQYWGYAYVGYSGNGAFNQSGGTNTPGVLYLGYNSGATGSYILSGTGSLQTVVSGEYIGYSGNGAFDQSGGTNHTSQLKLGFVAGSSGSYALSGTGALSVGGNEYVGDYLGNGTFNQTGGTNVVTGTLYVAENSGSSGTYNLQDGALTTSNLDNNNSFVQTGGTASAGVVTGTGTLSVGSATSTSAIMGVTTLAQNSVTINNAGQINMATNASGTTSAIGSLTLTGNGTLDIANNIVNISEATTSKGTVQGYIQSGYASGNWNGPGINSSSAASNPGRGIGYADNVDGTVAGLPANTVQVRYTLYGDTNLDGTVSIADVSNYAPNFNKPGSTFDWAQGDFNYDGTVSIADVSLAAPNFNQSLSASGLAVVAGSKSAGTLASAARPSVKFILSSNDNGQGVFTPGAFAVYAVDSTADGNSGLALYGVSLTGMSTITNLSPTSQIGSSVAGFYSFRSASDTAVPISGFQSAIGTGDTFTPIYALGQDGQILLATGTFSGSVAFNALTTDDVADVFNDPAGDLGAQLNVGNGEIVLATENLAPVPEPAAFGLLTIGAMGLFARRRRGPRGRIS